MGTLGFALIAGVLSTLSPCVLPLLPVVFGTALTEHRYGPVALAAGLSLSFVGVGLFVATLGFAAGFDHDLFRYAAAVVLLLIGAVLVLPRLQLQFATAAGPVGSWAQSRFDGLAGRGLGGQFLVGALLGALWTPCVGPTLGAASAMAARSENLGMVGLTMLAFGIGVAIPLVLIGVMSREALQRWRGRLMAAGSGGKMAMGGLLIVVGTMILTGFDKRIEALLVDLSPAWLTALTTRI